MNGPGCVTPGLFLGGLLRTGKLLLILGIYNKIVNYTVRTQRPEAVRWQLDRGAWRPSFRSHETERYYALVTMTICASVYLPASEAARGPRSDRHDVVNEEEDSGEPSSSRV